LWYHFCMWFKPSFRVFFLITYVYFNLYECYSFVEVLAAAYWQGKQPHPSKKIVTSACITCKSLLTYMRGLQSFCTFFWQSLVWGQPSSFWDVTQRGLVDSYQRFGKTCQSHLQGQSSPESLKLCNWFCDVSAHGWCEPCTQCVSCYWVGNMTMTLLVCTKKEQRFVVC